MRIGTGYDVHRLVEGRPLVLGGVTVPYDKGLLGHSDADVLLHAISDAILGAAALGDIGLHFPDNDPAYEGIDSRILLRKVGELVAEQCYVIANVDATIIAQRPKLRDYINEMRANIAEDLQITIGQVNVKATTEEGLGFTGAGEGIAAQAVCLLEPMVPYTEVTYGNACGSCEGCPGCRQ
ncbi:MAG: 2-C-methyl-D-erythritol 2,4-cyclodiphosphate synthase [Lachnospiraceae bacterium]|nr:2-C-methyl-D-erythritol 2,4-cyclodiphosphate synthase [Lachnospiraceae bacterium]